MYNPWSTHPTHTQPHTHAHHAHHGHGHGHGHHAHHAQVQAHQQHQQHHHHHQAPTVTTAGVPGTVPGTVTSTSGTRLDLPLQVDTSPSASPSQSSAAYPLSASGQMRWLPSMITPRSQTSSLPTISSGLRMQHSMTGSGAGAGAGPGSQGHSQQQQRGPMVMQARAAGQSLDTGVEVGVGLSQSPQVLPVGDESDRSDSPSGTPGTRDVGGTDALGEPDFAGDTGTGKVHRNGDLDVDVLGENANGKVANGDMNCSPGVNLSARKHGKRLTTKEEVSLFEICNRHAAEFGQRSNLCKWWMTVTMEFTRGQKHPYSWHSVRRKVEVVTKQRIKFLEEQRDKGANEAGDLSNPRWRAVVDAWIPTWQRWEEAETRRIEKRDSKRPRKRKWSGNTPTTTPSTAGTGPGPGDPWDISASAPNTGDWRAPSSTDSSPIVNHRAPSPTPLSSTPVRLPPGFDTLFSQSSQKPPSSTSTPYTYPSHNPNNTTPSTITTNPTPLTATSASNTNTATTATPDKSMMAAVLETLGKLNKHLDSNHNNPSNPHPTQNTHASSLLQNLNTTVSGTTGTPLSNPPSEPPSAQPMPSTQDSSLDSGPVNLADGMNLHQQHHQPQGGGIHVSLVDRLREELKTELLAELRAEWDKERAVLEEKIDAMQRTQELISEMLRQEPAQ